MRLFPESDCQFAAVGRAVLPHSLWLWPSLRSMQDSQNDYLFLTHLVNCEERERREGDLSRTVDAARASEVGERFQGADAFDYGLRHAPRGLRTAFCNVVTDPFEVVCGIRRPADAHQPR
jgi:hypothetical protein